MSYMDRIKACAIYNAADFVSFMVGNVQVGGIRHELVSHLRSFPDVFVINDAVSLAPDLDTYAKRTAAMIPVLVEFRDQGLISGWRDEPYAAGVSFSTPALFEMERAAVPLFGVKGYGVHMNGFVRDGDAISMWVGKRSLSKPTGPGKLDQMVAGGQPVGMGLKDNLVKECAEEAGIPEEIAVHAKPIGTITYLTDRPEGLRDDELFNFDLEVPAGFTPQNTDGEVDEFYLWPTHEVAERIQTTDDFKFNAALVVIDFLVRHGEIDADHPDYSDIVAGLHRQSNHRR